MAEFIEVVDGVNQKALLNLDNVVSIWLGREDGNTYVNTTAGGEFCLLKPEFDTLASFLRERGKVVK